MDFLQQVGCNQNALTGVIVVCMGLLEQEPDSQRARFEQTSDATLLAASRQNPHAFEAFVRRHYEPLLKKMESVCRNRDIAREIVNDAFVKAYTKSASYTPREGIPARAWLARIAMTTFLSHCRAQRRRAALPFDPETEYALTEAADEWSTQYELRDLIAVALSELPEDAARILRRYYLEGYSYADIAREEGVSYVAAKVRMFRARAALRHFLIAQGYAPGG
ncbi:RNA polymerase sigma factor [Candidatus Parcubacteria bacterium]|nr:MAG: RNA polymerase sigma factor [Candidatus Parcubacteria bacterium]